MSDLQWYPIPMKTVEDFVVFLPQKVFISRSFSIATRNVQVTFSEKPETKLNTIKEQLRMHT